MKKIFLIYAAPLVMLILLFLYGIVGLSILDNHHFDIITVNSVLAGFLFSSLSINSGVGIQ